MYSQITKSLQERYTTAINEGDNAITFNVISFCGHGCVNEKNESLFVVPEAYYDPSQDEQQLQAEDSTTDGGKAPTRKRPNSTRYRFINIDEYAKRFSCNAHSITIFQ